ncbi:hypothetical protein ACWEKT_01745 [Nocardia takedensis]
MDTEGRWDPEWRALPPRGLLGRAGSEFRLALREALSKAIALLDDLDESALVLARLEFAVAQRAREGVPIEAVLRVVHDSVRPYADRCGGAGARPADRRVRTPEVREVLELLTATVDRAYGKPTSGME